jgi:uncharacterized protein
VQKLALFLCLLAFPHFVYAQSYPDYSEVYVNDFADLLTADQEDEIRGKLTGLRQNRDIEFTVVTIDNMSDYGHSGAIEPFATGLFNRWGIGNANRNDGVMMLISRYDRKMRIEVGSGYGNIKNAAMKAIIEDVILPQFRKDNYPAGISNGVDAVILDLTGSWPGEYEAGPVKKLWRGLQRLISSLGGWIYAIIAPLLLLPVKIYRRWRRSSPRICPIDQNKMSRLDEDLDDEHLKQGQITEEWLKSVDYDVWECPKCDHVTIEAYRAWFTRYGACRTCGYRTLEGETTILEHATTESTGRKRIDYDCHNCQDHYSQIKIISRKSKSSSSSSSSSFGGGSSSGGGASGSW